MNDANANETPSLYDELLSDTNPEVRAQQQEQQPVGVDKEEYDSLRDQVKQQEDELARLRQQGDQFGRLKAALTEEEPSEQELEVQRLSAEFDREPGEAILKIKDDLKREHDEHLAAEKKALRYELIKKEITTEYDVDLNDKKVSKAIYDELMTMDQSYKDRDMRGALVKAMRNTGHDKKRDVPNHYADASSHQAYLDREGKKEGKSIMDGIGKAKASQGQGRVLGHIFGK